jgi:hypothetical protein
MRKVPESPFDILDGLHYTAFTAKAEQACDRILDIKNSDAVERMEGKALQMDDVKLHSASRQASIALEVAGSLMRNIASVALSLQSRQEFRLTRIEQPSFFSNLYGWADVVAIGRRLTVLDIGFGLRSSSNAWQVHIWSNLHPALADLDKVRTCPFVRLDA